MDKISSLPDECLVSIISLLPIKVAVSTSVLSKRWECLWMWLPKLEYYDSTRNTKSESKKLRCFLHRSLALHKAPVIEKLSLNFSSTRVKPEDMNLWIVVAASRCIRELEISHFSTPKNPIILPSSLFNNKSLVILKLYGEILLENVPRNVCLPSLKTLQLHSIIYACEESLQRLLSICPILEDLLVDLRGIYVNMKKLTIIVKCLQRLTLIIQCAPDLKEFVINTPSLEYFKLEDRIPKRHNYVIEDMPKLLEAYVDVVFPDINSLLGSMTSVKRSTLYISKIYEFMYGGGFFFKQLDHLKLCVSQRDLPSLLIRLLKDSPNLRILDIEADEKYSLLSRWNEPTMVPECVLSSLQIFNWSWYYGTVTERNIAVSILKNARGLKSATISVKEYGLAKLEIIKELELSSRASSTCKLTFY